MWPIGSRVGIGGSGLRILMSPFKANLNVRAAAVVNKLLKRSLYIILAFTWDVQHAHQSGLCELDAGMLSKQLISPLSICRDDMLLCSAVIPFGCQVVAVRYVISRDTVRVRIRVCRGIGMRPKSALLREAFTPTCIAGL